MKLLYGLAAVVVMLPMGLSAEEVKGPATFDQLDMNRDGYVSVIEATGHINLLRKWGEVDKNTDGRLEAAEFSAFEIEPRFVPPVDPDDADIGAAPHN